MSTLVFAVAVLALGSGFTVMLLRQQGRMLIRLEALERELVVWRLQGGHESVSSRGVLGDPVPQAKQPQELSLAKSRINRNGLPRGSAAPAFSLPRADGKGVVSLSDYAGRPMLLVFASPECGPCDMAMSRLARLPPEAVGPNVVVVGRGTPEANLAKVREHQPPFPVVLQEGWEVSRAYGTFTLPSACLVDAAGKVSSDLVVGPDAIVAMAEVLCETSQLPASASAVRRAV